MSFHISLSSLESIHASLMETLMINPDCESAPRGKPTNPRNRIITNPIRAVNYGFAVGELCWYLRGDNDLETMRYYNRRMAQFSDDGMTINSAYGNRIFRPRWRCKGVPTRSGIEASVSQFDNIVTELRHDPHSRRAVIHINEPADLHRAVTSGSKDVPCTMSLQLLIRDRRLHMHVLMRSNDVVWGLPYDVFSFTCLQEAFMLTLRDEGVEVDDIGEYHHTAGSLHLYDTHYEMATAISQSDYSGEGCLPMAPLDLERLRALAHEDEQCIREESWADLQGCRHPKHSEDSIGWMYAQLVDHWNKRQREKEKNHEQQT